jgi:hypothetical protein
VFISKIHVSSWFQFSCSISTFKIKGAPQGVLFILEAIDKEQANLFACVGNRKAFPYRAKRDGKAPAAVAETSRHLHFQNK